jgi:hypothetical protein
MKGGRLSSFVKNWLEAKKYGAFRLFWGISFVLDHSGGFCKKGLHRNSA